MQLLQKKGGGHKIGWKCIKCREKKSSNSFQRPKLMNPFSLQKQRLQLVGLFQVHQIKQVSLSSAKNQNQITKLQFSEFIYPDKYIQDNHQKN